MAVEWTAEQKKIISLRDRNLLVAAAAGSGKTAVLVERIMSMITDPEKPVDLDRLLVVTFTRAAASQMRERIGKRLSELLEKFPSDKNLKRQEDILPHAKIMTIDSFCLYVVRNFFDSLPVEPDFRIGDEGELKLIREDVMEELLEQEYAEGSEAFLEFVDCYGEGKADGGIAEYIETLYQFVSAYPDPEGQLASWEAQLSPDGEPEWMKSLRREVSLEAESLKEQYLEAERAALEAGIDPYAGMFRSDRRLAERLLEAESYGELQKVLSEIPKRGAFMTKPRLKKELQADEEQAARLSAMRDECKELLKGLAKQYDLGPWEQVSADLEGCRAPLAELLRLAARFGRLYLEAKRERNLADFNDVAHYALQILTVKEEGKLVPSETAKELSESFYEIMIDEYQDSNRLQEAILTSISTERAGRPDIFMVGDVKQSIYRFRQARPELFMEKYDTYTEEESLYQKIDLHKNFRSRREVLESVNLWFSQLMERRLGGVSYDGAAALIPGREFPGTPERMDYRTELIFMDTKDEEDARKQEAAAVVRRIRELTDPARGLLIQDSASGEYRRAGYGDIVILLRTVDGWAETFSDSLMEAGIPAYAQTRTGYFSAREVQCVLHVLRIIDNPMQDIPLAAVLASPMGGFSAEELAQVTARFKGDPTPKEVRGLYGALTFFARSETAEDGPLREKAAAFLGMLEDFRQKAVYMPLHRLLRYILKETGYEYILAAMPGGELRTANVEMLIKRAVDYENTSYRGVFQFVRYIERLQKYSVDFGEASPAAEGAGAVRITSIHKSKGLEYPIVFLAGAGKRFNQQDSNKKILLHPELGIGADYIDRKNRLRAPTLAKRVLQRRLRLENLGEELRVLYVALTRAQEKLIVTGTDRSLEAKLTKWDSLRLTEETALPYGAVARGGSYLDWLLMACARTGAMERLLAERGITPPVFHSLYQREACFFVSLETPEELARKSVLHQLSGELMKEQLKGKRAPGELAKAVDESLSWSYPFMKAVLAPRKFSVSELKEAAAPEPESAYLYGTEEEEPKRPKFLEEDGFLTGAERGTAYHKLLELLPFDTEPEAVGAAVKELERQGLLPDGAKGRLRTEEAERLLRSPLGRRMAAAQRAGTLKKEQQFVMEVPAAAVSGAYRELSGEGMLIQGVIDAWFEEDGELVLVDYKTDRVRYLGEAAADWLKDRYRVQLEHYGKALEMGTGKPVKERYLYSFDLGLAIPV